MGLKPKIEICQGPSCDKFTPKDVTGVYDADNNTTGWESPNTSGSDVTKAEIKITWPDGSSKEYDVTSQVPDTVTDEFEYNTIEEDFPDGEYTIEYNIQDSDSDLDETHKITSYLFCHVECCVDKLWSRLYDELCKCDNESFAHQVLIADALLFALKSSAGCEDSDKFQDQLDRLKRICDFEDCNC